MSSCLQSAPQENESSPSPKKTVTKTLNSHTCFKLHYITKYKTAINVIKIQLHNIKQPLNKQIRLARQPPVNTAMLIYYKSQISISILYFVLIH